ncbi:Uncharacterised protein [Vibrio cholerae]|uniref:Uncharacterized protein n=1 Tax=Vibrio cholerae TaxID=666 RepID=A0A656AP86_VIBCL|nr:Uncharacterised protein [Vibrio cholerae]CSI62772.1 Uncharacterised protein [Vibrio cholerae]
MAASCTQQRISPVLNTAMKHWAQIVCCTSSTHVNINT